ncbi:MAG: rRNA maturation RNase YbeY [Proteobacteria bacterium]|jgi:probable rRNA maturation factor|nr:rRNA maturation RNase YbeY [Pseudomonadota bacterium]
MPTKNIQMINVVIQNTVTKKNIFSAALCHQLFTNVWNKNAEITIRITNYKESKKLNRQFRNMHSATNILSFLIDNKPSLIGDLILCHDIVKKEAKIYKKKIKDHYIHLVLHGFLHLIGYDHIEKNEQKKMESLEIKILKKYKINNPYLTI